MPSRGFSHSSQSHSAAWPVPGALCKAYSHLFDSMPLRCSFAYFCATPERIPSVPCNSISDLFLAVLRSSISILCQSHLSQCHSFFSPPCSSTAALHLSIPYPALASPVGSSLRLALPTLRLPVRPGPFRSIQSYSGSWLCASVQYSSVAQRIPPGHASPSPFFTVQV